MYKVGRGPCLLGTTCEEWLLSLPGVEAGLTHVSVPRLSAMARVVCPLKVSAGVSVSVPCDHLNVGSKQAREGPDS